VKWSSVRGASSCGCLVCTGVWTHAYDTVCMHSCNPAVGSCRIAQDCHETARIAPGLLEQTGIAQDCPGLPFRFASAYAGMRVGFSKQRTVRVAWYHHQNITTAYTCISHSTQPHADTSTNPSPIDGSDSHTHQKQTGAVSAYTTSWRARRAQPPLH